MTNPLVLMVDDELDNRVMMRYFLESWGYAVELADNGEQGVKLTTELQPALVILDLEMPVMDGFEACRRIKESAETEHIPVMLFTGLGSTANKVKGIRAGADDYVVKTVDPEEIQARIEMILRRSRRYAPAPSDTTGAEDAVLSGSLEEKSFPEAFQLAMAYGQSGTLSLTDGDRHGHVYLIDGNAVHAELEPFTGEAAFYKFCTWDKGQFTYQIGETSSERSIELRGQSLLLEATRRMDEWERIAAKIPSLDTVVFKQTAREQESVTLNRREWRIVAAVDGRRTLREIAARLELSEAELERSALELLASEVLSLDPKAAERSAIFDAVPELRDELEGEEPFVLTAAQWRLLAHIDGIRDFGALTPLLGLSPRHATVAIKELVDRGFLRMGAAQPAGDPTESSEHDSSESSGEATPLDEVDNIEAFPTRPRAVGID